MRNRIIPIDQRPHRPRRTRTALPRRKHRVKHISRLIHHAQIGGVARPPPPMRRRHHRDEGGRAVEMETPPLGRGILRGVPRPGCGVEGAETTQK